MVSPAELRSMFENRLKEGIPNPPGEFHPQDLERVKDDKYLSRIIAHHDNDAKLACDMLWDIMTWRKTVGANDINENTVRMDYVNDGYVFPRGRDIDGCLLFIIKSKNHIKGTKNMDEVKKVLIYWLDRIEREEGGHKITLFFDMDGCGLSNFDMELIKYIINLFKYYYPYFLNYIVIFQMPWVLSAAFKVVKSLLPAKAVEIMKFVSKDTLKDFVSPEQALFCWGGKDDYTFKFVPEKSGEHTPKKVTFAEQGDHKHSLGEMLRLVPNDVIIFKKDNDEGLGQFIITNMDESAISFKIRTTSPEKFRVRPSSGTLAPGASHTITIVVQQGFQVTKDRFLVMCVQIPKTDMSQNELTEVWKNSSGSKVDEYRLKCHYPDNTIIDNNITKNGSVLDGRTQVIHEKADSVVTALNNLQINYDTLNRTVHRMQYIQILILILTLVVAGFGYLIYQSQDIANSCSI